MTPDPLLVEPMTTTTAPVAPRHLKPPHIGQPTTEDLDVDSPASGTQKVAMLIAVIFPFIGLIVAVALMWMYGWMGWAYLAMVVLGWGISCLGVTIGFHRLMSHKSFETYRWVRGFWTMVGTMSVEGAPLTWCAVHRRHHSYSDRHGDPHSPRLHGDGFWDMLRGLWHSQVGWLFSGIWSEPNLEKYIPDLLKDPLLIRINKHYGLLVLLSLAIPTVIGYLIEGSWVGAWLGFLWGGLVRVFFTHHVTWSINSICHVFGSRDYKSNDHSTNNVVCGVLAMGEGWHNNHHAFPASARHGLKWWQFDLSWLIIRTMKLTGLAWNIRLPSEHAVKAKRIN